VRCLLAATISLPITIMCTVLSRVYIHTPVVHVRLNDVRLPLTCPFHFFRHICFITIIQSAQSKILRTITNAPWYVSNHTLHTDLKTPYVREVIRENSTKYFNKLENHCNTLLQPLLQPHQNRRLQRTWPQI
jgi:hypothetical protein